MAANEHKTHWGLGPISFDGADTPVKTALFVIVCLAWLLPGLVGHDPWKTDEAVAFGTVAEMLRTGDWLRFGIAGEPVAGDRSEERRVGKECRARGGAGQERKSKRARELNRGRHTEP